MIELQQECIEKLGPIEKMEAPLSIDYSDEIYAAVEAAGTERIAETQKIADKTDRQNAEAEVNAALVAELEGQFADTDDAVKQIKAAARSVMKKVVRKRIVEEGIRIDGRGAADLRKVTSRSVLSRRRTARASSSVARPRFSTSRRSAWAAAT